MADKPLGVRRIETEGGMVVEGNPEAVPLHEALSAVSDWMDYESDVVQEAADELKKEGHSELADKAEDQAEAMEEAAAAVDDAADEAREAAAVAFNEEGKAAVEIAAEDSPEGEVVGGNPYSSMDAEELEKARAALVEEDARLEIARQALAEGSPPVEKEVIMGNPTPEEWTVDDALDFFDAEIEAEEQLREEGKLGDVDADLKGMVEDLLAGHTGRAESYIQGTTNVDMVIKGNPLSLQAKVARGNPDPPPIPEADPTPDPPPVPDPSPDTPPESNHWYDRPLIRR